MNSKVLLYKILTSIVILFFILGCGARLPEYQPRTLNSEKAKSILITQTPPYNCVLLTQMSGKDDAIGKNSTTINKLCEGAYNDLRNKAATIKSDRLIFNIIEEKLMCDKFFLYDCTSLKQNLYISDINLNGLLSCEVQAQLFDCSK